MNTNLFNRSLGVIGTQTLQRAETTRLLDALQAAPNVKFDSRYKSSKQIESHNDQEEASVTWAHRQGVNSLAIDRFEGRLYASPKHVDSALSCLTSAFTKYAIWRSRCFDIDVGPGKGRE